MAELVGLKELSKSLQAVAEAVIAAAGRAADESAEAIRDDMRRHVPVDTGKLRAGIADHKVNPLTHEIGVSDPKLYYGKFIEHGTSSMPAQPFALPAAERERRRFPQRAADAINKELT